MSKLNEIEYANLWWVERANCRTKLGPYNHDMVEPLHRDLTAEEQQRAARYCAECTVYEQCRAWACESTIDPLPYFYAAGMTSRQRQQYRHLRSLGDTTICTCIRCRNRQRRPDNEKRETDEQPEQTER